MPIRLLVYREASRQMVWTEYLDDAAVEAELVAAAATGDRARAEALVRHGAANLDDAVATAADTEIVQLLGDLQKQRTEQSRKAWETAALKLRHVR